MSLLANKIPFKRLSPNCHFPQNRQPVQTRFSPSRQPRHASPSGLPDKVPPQNLRQDLRQNLRQDSGQNSGQNPGPDFRREHPPGSARQPIRRTLRPLIPSGEPGGSRQERTGSRPCPATGNTATSLAPPEGSPGRASSIRTRALCSRRMDATRLSPRPLPRI